MYRVTLINDGIETIIHSELNTPDAPTLIDGIVKPAINKIASFNFTILPNNPGYDLIFPLRTLVEVINTKTNKIEFYGRILMPTESMSDEGLFAKSFVCESELGYLNDSCQRHGEYHNISVENFLEIIISNHNKDISNDEIDKTFVLGNVTVNAPNLYRYLGYEKTFETIKDKLLDRLGGELIIRKENGVRYLDYLEHHGEYKSTEIRLSKNLKSIEKEVDPTEIITKLIPLGVAIESEEEGATDASQARLTIESVNGGKDFIEDTEARSIYGVVAKSQTWDDITLPQNLLERGQQFLHENNRVKIKHVITAYDLYIIGIDPDSFELYNYYPVINPVMGINEHLRIVEMTINILNPEQNTFTVGDLFKTASEYQSESNRTQKNVIELQNRIVRQSQIINGLKSELTDVDNAIESINILLDENDIPALEQAVQDLQTAINNLNQAIDNIPDYGPVTPESNGLMISADKVKLDLINVLNSINLDDLKNKLDLITVVNHIDLDNLEARVAALEEPTE